jgi:hypothetical protein
MRIAISKDGEIQAIYSDELAPVLASLGHATTTRASHVEPREDGLWQADMSPCGGGLLPPTATRQESLDLETAWLNERLGKL